MGSNDSSFAEWARRNPLPPPPPAGWSIRRPPPPPPAPVPLRAGAKPLTPAEQSAAAQVFARRTSLRRSPPAKPKSECKSCSGSTTAWVGAAGEDDSENRARFLGASATGSSTADHMKGNAEAGFLSLRGAARTKNGNGVTGEVDVLYAKAAGEAGVTANGMGYSGEASAVGARAKVGVTTPNTLGGQTTTAVEGTLGYAAAKAEYFIGDNGGDRVGIGAGAQLEATAAKATVSQKTSIPLPGGWSIDFAGSRDIGGGIGGGGGASAYYSKTDQRYHADGYGAVAVLARIGFDTHISIGPTKPTPKKGK